MNEINKTLFIPLYGKAAVSKKGLILKDESAERIWEAEGFRITGKAKSKWLTYNMAMRARVFDDWTDRMLRAYPNAVVLHIGCGLDSRCLRVTETYRCWIDGDFPDVLERRKQYFSETEQYHMMAFNAARPETAERLPDSDVAIVVLEGISMYLRNEELNGFFQFIRKKYPEVHILMDVYTVFAAKASKYKNPIHDVGVTQVWGIDHIEDVLAGTDLRCVQERSLTPDHLVNELKASERFFFKLLFQGSIYRKIYRLYEISGGCADSQ